MYSKTGANFGVKHRAMVRKKIFSFPFFHFSFLHLFISFSLLLLLDYHVLHHQQQELRKGWTLCPKQQCHG
jgi:hypothetical protein